MCIRDSNNSVAPGREIKHEKRLADLIKREDSPRNVDIHIDKAGGLPIKHEDSDDELLSRAATSTLLKHANSDVSKITDDASSSKDSHQETSIIRTSSSSSHTKTSSFSTSCTPTEYRYGKSSREETIETTSTYKHASSKTHKVIANNTPEMSENGTHDSSAESTEESTSSNTTIRTESERRTITIVRDNECEIVTIRSETSTANLRRHATKTLSRSKTTSKISIITMIQPSTYTSITVKRTPGRIVAGIHTVATGL